MRAVRLRAVLPLLALVLAGAVALRPLARLYRRQHHSADLRLASAPDPLADRYGDGYPEFLRLRSEEDRTSFRRWFTLIADNQAIAKKLPPEVTDCASLLRYSYREALRRHDAAWQQETRTVLPEPLADVRAWNYPHTPLGANLFRVRAGVFVPANLGDGSFAEFADAKSLVAWNTYRISRDPLDAQPGDLLFWQLTSDESHWHSMILTRLGAEPAVLYHTGPDGKDPGEIRRVLLADLLRHPDPRWRPVASNPNFLGVYRWKILRDGL